MVATFGGGCFWCTEVIFQRLEGVERVTPGYMGGNREHPTYEQVCSGATGHAEVIRSIITRRYCLTKGYWRYFSRRMIRQLRTGRAMMWGRNTDRLSFTMMTASGLKPRNSFVNYRHMACTMLPLLQRWHLPNLFMKLKITIT